MTSSDYLYYPYSLTTNSSTSGEKKGISSSEPAYVLIFSNTSEDDTCYWVANATVITFEGYIALEMCNIYDGYFCSDKLWDSRWGERKLYTGVRAVITLSADVQIQ